ncbi:MAG TPA: divalent-cation tolerance protein CutA [Candidatus Komeilibacteria bacterium]|nr:divalent-cation tolerance protein CutA [Candidatus Komeilibacteria bacterium]
MYTVCKNKTEAKKIATMLLKLKLIACANYWPAESVYRWQNKIVNGREVVLILKTRKNYYKKIEGLIKKMHRDETPCLLKIMPAQVEPDYLAWLKRETQII